MRGHTLITIYAELRRIGVVRSQRDYAARYLGRGKTFLRDLEARSGLSSWISEETTRRLNDRLDRLKQFLPEPMQEEVGLMINLVVRDRYVAGFLASSALARGERSSTRSAKAASK